MAVPLTCPNGHLLRVNDEFAGMRVKCMKCGAIMVVPKPSESNAGEEFAGVAESADKPVAEVWPRRNEILWMSAGGLAGFVAVLVPAIILMIHHRGRPAPQEALAAPTTQVQTTVQSSVPQTTSVQAVADSPKDDAPPADLAKLSAPISIPSIFRPEVAVSLLIGVADPRVDVRLLDGPKDATIENDVLAWTPRRADVGKGKITLRYHADGERKDRSFEYVVSEVALAPSFEPQGFSASPDGRLAVVWGWAGGTSQHDARSGLCVVDVPKNRIVAECTVPQVTGSVSLSGDRAFVLSKGNTLQVLQLSDLAVVRMVSLFRESDHVDVVADRFVHVKGGTVSLPDLTEVPSVALALAGDTRIEPLYDGWLAGAAAMDDDLREVRFFHRFVSPANRLLAVSPTATGGLGQAFQISPSSVRLRGHERIDPNVGVTVENMKGFSRVCVKSRTNGPSNNVPVVVVGEPFLRRDSLAALSSGSTIAVLLWKQFVVTDFQTLGLAAPPVVKPDLVVRPAPKQFVLSSEGKTPVRFTARGGKPPYKFSCEVVTDEFKSPVGATAKLVSDGAAAGEFLIDGESLAAALTEFSKSRIGRDRWNPWFANYSGTSSDIVESYIADATASLEAHVGRKFDNAPVGVPIVVTATDADGQHVSLLHSMIVEVPRNQVVEAVERRPRARPESLLDDAASRLKRRIARSLPTPVLWSPQTVETDLSNRIRQAWPRVELPAELPIESIAAMLTRDRGLEVILHGGSVRAFEEAHGCLPPRALMDSGGKPLLSWRVLLLPHMGHADLFSLFRLDEPWDSEHNRKLIPFVPRVFVSSREALPAGHSSVLALVGPRTAFPPNGVRRVDSFVDDPHETLIIVEVAKEASVIWTKPDDLEIGDDPAVFDKLARQTTPERRVTGFRGLFARDGMREIPFNTNRDVLMRAARVDDGVRSGIRKDND